MLTVVLSTTQEVVIHVPKTGLDKNGRSAPLEGTPVVTVDTGGEFVTIAPDPSDPEGLTLLLKAVSAGLGSATVQRDARIGGEEVLISANLVWEVAAADAVSFDLTADDPREQGGTPPQARASRR